MVTRGKRMVCGIAQRRCLESIPGKEWVAGLLEHHLEVQRHKPPDRKNPWFETLPDGSVMVRAAYRRPEAPNPTEEYVHAYRTGALWSFARDLGMIKE